MGRKSKKKRNKRKKRKNRARARQPAEQPSSSEQSAASADAPPSAGQSVQSSADSPAGEAPGSEDSEAARRYPPVELDTANGGQPLDSLTLPKAAADSRRRSAQEEGKISHASPPGEGEAAEEGEPPDGGEPLVDRELPVEVGPPASGEPLADRELPVEVEPTAGGEPLADRELPVEVGPTAAARPSRMIIALNILFIAAMAVILISHELMTSQFQSMYFARVASELTFFVGDGKNHGLPEFDGGPYDKRLGYSLIGPISRSLQEHDFKITRQARLSEPHRELVEAGVFPIYREKSQAGLLLFDRTYKPMFISSYPQSIFGRLEEVPQVVIDTLLYIEDRELLSVNSRWRNPALNWPRLFKASLDMLKSKLYPGQQVPGGSTLATQIEKFRHSPDGITGSPSEKLRQMASATLRAYRNGRDTQLARLEIVLTYLNSVPLAALAGHGEVNGLAEGLWAYFGTTRRELVEQLGAAQHSDDPAELDKAGRIYRQVLSLFLAHRRPSELLRDPIRLQRQVDVYLDLLHREGVVRRPLYEAAKRAQLDLRRQLAPVGGGVYVERKAQNLIRTHLLTLTGLERLYDLDRLDMSAATTLDSPLQNKTTAKLLRLKDPEEVRALGLDGRHLFARRGDLSKVIYSFTLYESDGKVNKLRIQTDSLDQPFNVNEGVKLDLGSTAKLRTLITYLEVIEEIYGRYRGMEKSELSEALKEVGDPLSRWGVEYLRSHPGAELSGILEAAMDRRYSASPAERFFTAGGRHTFENFSSRDNGRVVSVREATRNSINLPFIRLMRDLTLYFQVYTSGSSHRALESMADMDRREYLERFADKEGKIFLSRFFRKYGGKSPQEILEVLLDGVEYKPRRFSAIFWVLHPEARFEDFAAFMRVSFAERDFSEQDLVSLFNVYADRDYSLADKGYLARVHPLELWLAAYLYAHPDAGLSQVYEAGAMVRQEVYGWLFNSKRRAAQDKRIRTMLEAEAFVEIHRRWKRLGYSLDSLVPSYATALGTSADRPASLAELMGIIVNDGKRLPMMRVRSIEFGTGTPFETSLVHSPQPGEQVLSPEIAGVVRRALADVVENGTAVRLRGGIEFENDKKLSVGGKTGTGDHRFHVYGPSGVLREARVVNRTATFVFFIGDRFFGTITVIVRGEEAERFRFTSSLPVQLLKTIGPQLEPLLGAG